MCLKVKEHSVGMAALQVWPMLIFLLFLLFFFFFLRVVLLLFLGTASYLHLCQLDVANHIGV